MPISYRDGLSRWSDTTCDHVTAQVPIKNIIARPVLRARDPRLPRNSVTLSPMTTNRDPEEVRTRPPSAFSVQVAGPEFSRSNSGFHSFVLCLQRLTNTVGLGHVAALSGLHR